MNLPSKIVEDAVNEIAKLPGIGKKTALRLALFLLKKEPEFTSTLTLSLDKLRNDIRYCGECKAYSDAEICTICSNKHRDRTTICVVEEVTDMLAIENTMQYNGLYHILGGVISPIEGISPENLNIDSLIQRVNKHEIKEIILAISASMEGETTAFYLHKKLKSFPIKVSTIARGVPVGSELGYTDEVTLGRSIIKRTPL